MILTEQIMTILNNDKRDNISIELYSEESKLYASMQFDLRYSREIVMKYDFNAKLTIKFKNLKQLESHLEYQFNLTDWSAYKISDVSEITF
jgi:hypothetical protein|tara:strand:- start:1341 stop:1613 length:273 start_codon:yes stop_codon:yes gene_type:complete